MSPDELVMALGKFHDLSQKRAKAKEGAVASMKGVRVRGHRIWKKGDKVVVAGPSAPVVALEVKDRMARGAVKAVRGSL